MTLATAALALDEAVESWLDRNGGSPWARSVARSAAVSLSNASDYGLVWILVSAMRARAPGARRCRAVVELATAGAASYAANRVVKRLVGRSRPPDQDATSSPATAVPVRRRGPGVRAPTSSSFPSGHTLAAFTASVVLAEDPAATLGWLGFSSGVALSRVYLRAHHATDALGGMVIGLALGTAVRPLARRVTECACASGR